MEFINFKEESLKEGKKILVKFYATWCGPCKIMNNVIDGLITEKKLENVDLFSIDVDKDNELADKYGIRSLPTIMFFEGGNEIKKIGLISKKEVLDLIN